MVTNSTNNMGGRVALRNLSNTSDETITASKNNGTITPLKNGIFEINTGIKESSEDRLKATKDANRSETQTMIMMTSVGLLVAGIWQFMLTYPLKFFTFLAFITIQPLQHIALTFVKMAYRHCFGVQFGLLVIGFNFGLDVDNSSVYRVLLGCFVAASVAKMMSSNVKMVLSIGGYETGTVANIVVAAYVFVAYSFLMLTWPQYAFYCQAFWALVDTFLQRRERIAKIKSLRDDVLNLTFDRLSECNDHEGWAVLMLRDDVASYLHPTNWTERQFIIDYVWPSVYVLIQADNRVRKFRKLAHGRELEHWDFDVESKKMRKSMSAVVQGEEDL